MPAIVCLHRGWKGGRWRWPGSGCTRKRRRCARLVLDTPLSNSLGHRFYFRCGLLATVLRRGDPSAVTEILHLRVSPRAELSWSRQVAGRLTARLAALPGARVLTRDFAAQPPPHSGGRLSKVAEIEGHA